MKRLKLPRRHSRQPDNLPTLDYPESRKSPVATWEAALVIAVPVAMVVLWLLFSVHPALLAGILGLLIACEIRFGILKITRIRRSGARGEGFRQYSRIAWRTLRRIAKWVIWVPKSP